MHINILVLEITATTTQKISSALKYYASNFLKGGKEHELTVTDSEFTPVFNIAKLENFLKTYISSAYLSISTTLTE